VGDVGNGDHEDVPAVFRGLDAHGVVVVAGGGRVDRQEVEIAQVEPALECARRERVGQPLHLGQHLGRKLDRQSPMPGHGAEVGLGRPGPADALDDATRGQGVCGPTSRPAALLRRECLDDDDFTGLRSGQGTLGHVDAPARIVAVRGDLRTAAHLLEDPDQPVPASADHAHQLRAAPVGRADRLQQHAVTELRLAGTRHTPDLARPGGDARTLVAPPIPVQSSDLALDEPVTARPGVTALARVDDATGLHELVELPSELALGLAVEPELSRDHLGVNGTTLRALCEELDDPAPQRPALAASMLARARASRATAAPSPRLATGSALCASRHRGGASQKPTPAAMAPAIGPVANCVASGIAAGPRGASRLHLAFVDGASPPP